MTDNSTPTTDGQTAELPTTRQTAVALNVPPKFNCPTCDRPALVAAPDEIVTWRCGSCGQRVTETGGEA